MTREEREARAAEAFPLGSVVSVTVHRIGGSSEDVRGEVVGHDRGLLTVKPDPSTGYGPLSVPMNDCRKKVVS